MGILAALAAGTRPPSTPATRPPATPATPASPRNATFASSGCRSPNILLATANPAIPAPIAASAVSKPVSSVSASTIPASNNRGVPTARRSANSSIRSPTVANPTFRIPAEPISSTRIDTPRNTQRIIWISPGIRSSALIVSTYRSPIRGSAIDAYFRFRISMSSVASGAARTSADPNCGSDSTSTGSQFSSSSERTYTCGCEFPSSTTPRNRGVEFDPALDTHLRRHLEHREGLRRRLVQHQAGRERRRTSEVQPPSTLDMQWPEPPEVACQRRDAHLDRLAARLALVGIHAVARRVADHRRAVPTAAADRARALVDRPHVRFADDRAGRQQRHRVIAAPDRGHNDLRRTVDGRQLHP